MFFFRRKGIRRRGRAAGKTARRTGGWLVLRLALRVLRPLGPGVIAAAARSYFLDPHAGGERRKQALSRVGGLSRGRGRKTE